MNGGSKTSILGRWKDILLGRTDEFDLTPEPRRESLPRVGTYKSITESNRQKTILEAIERRRRERYKTSSCYDAQGIKEELGDEVDEILEETE
jgi:hypothetical protein